MAEATMNNPIKRAGATLYMLNDARRAANRWTAHVQPGQDDDGKRISDVECQAVAERLATAVNSRVDMIGTLERLAAYIATVQADCVKRGRLMDADIAAAMRNDALAALAATNKE